MPEPSKTIEQDFASPAREDQLIVLLADDSLMGKGVKDENGDDNNSRQSIEIMDASQTFTKPPAVRVKENASKGYRPIPLLQLVSKMFFKGFFYLGLRNWPLSRP